MNFLADGLKEEDHLMGLYVRQIWLDQIFYGDMWKQLCMQPNPVNRKLK